MWRWRTEVLYSGACFGFVPHSMDSTWIVLDSIWVIYGLLPHSMDSISHSSVPEPPSHPTRWKCRSPWQNIIIGKAEKKMVMKIKGPGINMKYEIVIVSRNIGMCDLRSMAMPMLLFVGNWFIWRRSNCWIEIKFKPLLDMFLKVFFLKWSIESRKSKIVNWKQPLTMKPS